MPTKLITGLSLLGFDPSFFWNSELSTLDNWRFPDAFIVGGEPLYFFSIRLFTGGQINLQIATAAFILDGEGQELVPEMETGGTITLTTPLFSMVLSGISDHTEPYIWTPTDDEASFGAFRGAEAVREFVYETYFEPSATIEFDFVQLGVSVDATPANFNFHIPVAQVTKRRHRAVNATPANFGFNVPEASVTHRRNFKVDASPANFNFEVPQAGVTARGLTSVNATPARFTFDVPVADVKIVKSWKVDASPANWEFGSPEARVRKLIPIPPNPPSGLTIEVTGRVARISWTPGEVNRFPVTHYEISIGDINTGVSDTYLVQTLNYLERYQVSIVAVSRAGVSEPLEGEFVTGFIPVEAGEFDPFGGITELPVLNEEITSRFDLVGESLSVFAARLSLELVKLVFENALDYRISRYTDWETISDTNLILWLQSAKIPDGTIFGLAFQRLVYRDKYFWFNGRGTIGLLDKFAQEAEFNYSIIEWVLTNGFRTGVEICVARLDGGAPTSDWLNAIKTWVNWIYPTLSEVTVITCQVESFTLYQSLTTYYHMSRFIEVG